MVLLSIGQQVLCMSLIGLTPFVWLQVNDTQKALDLIQKEQFSDLIVFVNERSSHILLTSGCAAMVSGAAYLQLPLKIFLGWVPFIGRVDDLMARLLLFSGFTFVALAFYKQFHYLCSSFLVLLNINANSFLLSFL